MVIDTSAVFAVLAGESDARELARKLSDAPRRLMSAVTLLECEIVIHAKKGGEGLKDFHALIAQGGVEIVPFDREQASLAHRAWTLYGKGRHAAALNICDCCSYALSIALGMPLLFKGDDFPRTDAIPA